VTVGGGTSGLVLSVGSPGASGASRAIDAMDLDNNNHDKDNDYDNNGSSAGHGNKDPDGTGTPLEEDIDACNACLLHGIVQTDKDYSFGEIVQLLDASATALDMFNDIELQAHTYFELCFVMRTVGFSKDCFPIYYQCLW
jgi:hypothetical protein